MSAMQVTVREFTRKFPNYRRAALAGKEVRVRAAKAREMERTR